MIGFNRDVTLRYISRRDKALDLERTDLDKYIATGDFEQFMKVKEGAQPTIFRLRPLTRLQFQHVSGLAQNLQNSAVVAYGVEDVEHGKTAKTGRDLAVKRIGEGNDKRLDGDTLDAMFSPSLFTELAIVILAISDLDPLD